MPIGMWVVAGWMAFVSLSALALIAWGLKSRQFDDVEGPKYRMLEDLDLEGWPRRRCSKGV